MAWRWLQRFHASAAVIAVTAAMVGAGVYVGLAKGSDDDRRDGDRESDSYTIGLVGDTPYNELGRAQYPALLADGDSHYFKMDKPINGPTDGVLANFTRIETFGARNTQWVSATIDENNPNLFNFEPRIVTANTR
jgi:hypothetical protein